MLHPRMDENLTFMLHCDDKQKLKERLVLLQREYNRTVQRLKRAERYDAVRKHVRGKIAEQNLHREEPEPGKLSEHIPGDTKKKGPSSVYQSGPEDQNKSPAVRFSLPHDGFGACDRLSDTPQAGSPTPAHGHGRRPTNRLRSRRSRLRWESRERAADSGVSDTENSEDGRDPNGNREWQRDSSLTFCPSIGTGLSEAVSRPAVDHSGEAGPHSPALGGTGTEMGFTQEKLPENVPTPTHRQENGSNSKVACDSLVHVMSEALLPDTSTVEMEPEAVVLNVSAVQMKPEEVLLDSSTAPTLEPVEQSGSSPQAAAPSPSEAEGACPEQNGAPEPEPQAPMEEGLGSSASPSTPAPDPLGSGYLSSCTLVEGLLFPVEYYVRTTRRMSAAQSSVDLGAVIQSQLTGGRRGRGRRRGRGGSATAARDSRGEPAASGSHMVSGSVSQATPESESSQTSRSSPAASGPEPPTVKPIRGGSRRGRRRGGRGWRRGRAVPMATPCSDGSRASEHLIAEADLPPDTDPHPETDEKKLYPIFCTKSQLSVSSSPQISQISFITESSQSKGKEYLRASRRSLTAGVKYDSLLLPSSPAPQRPPVFTLGGTRLSLHFLLSHLDAKDFHLPDDEFGILKQDKLRLFTDRDLEAFAPLHPRYATRQRATGTPSGNARARKRLSAVRRLPPTDGLRNAQTEGQPAELASQSSSGQTDLGSDRDTPESLTPSLTSIEVTHQEEKRRSCDTLPLRLENGAECVMKSLSPHGECAGSVETAAAVEVGEGNGKGQEGAGSILRSTPVDLGAPSPHVTNLSPAPVVPTQKSQVPVFPSWGSPAFPSLGVTPAFPLHPSSPSQNCTPTLSKSQGPLSQPTHLFTTPSAPRQGPAISCEPKKDTQLTSASPSSTPDSKAHYQSQNAPQAAVEELELSRGEDPADGDQCPAPPHLPDSTVFPLTDSLSSSLFCSSTVSALFHNPAVCPSEEGKGIHSSPVPQRVEGADAQSPLPGPPKTPCADSQQRGEGAQSDGTDTSTVTKVTPSVPLNDESDVLLTESGRPGCKDTHIVSVSPCVEEDDFDPLKTPAHEAYWSSARPSTPGQTSQPSPSNGLENEDKDLDCYFTDSAWSRGALSQPQSGDGSPGRGCAEGQVSTPPLSPPAVQEDRPACGLKLTHTLKAPPNRSLVDLCSVFGAAGWCIAAAEEWAHPVIALLSVPDAPSLVCVTLGKLEIREARVLSCVSAGGPLSQVVLCSGEVQAVLGVSGGRVACCVNAAYTQTVSVLTLTEEGRLKDSVSLVWPGLCVQALAAVDGQTDALIGSTDSGHIVIWNMKTGHLLQKIPVGEGLSGTVCLRGYSESGVLFVLLQHQFLHNLNQEEAVPFSLIATNPVTARSVVVHQLAQPSQCVGRDGDGMARLFRGPEEGCLIARWGRPNSLLTGHLNGDVSLYQYTLPG
ncbi:hypothetical protein JZ751_026123, partial [Albula glossodonta]